MSLTNKQRAFVNEYIQCWNATEAARRAGYSEKTARSIGSENLTKPDIKQEIDERIAEMAMGANEALHRLSDMARASIEDFVDINPNITNAVFLNFDKARQGGKLHLIKKLKYNSNGFPEIELHDAQAALIQIARHLGLFKDDNQPIINNQTIRVESVGLSSVDAPVSPDAEDDSTGALSV